MNYFEILMWIQENIVSLRQNMDDTYDLTYLDMYGAHSIHTCNDLIAGVLAINDCDLITAIS